MEFVKKDDLRAIEAGAKYTATRRCGLCGKKIKATKSHWFYPMAVHMANVACIANWNKHVSKCRG